MYVMEIAGRTRGRRVDGSASRGAIVSDLRWRRANPCAPLGMRRVRARHCLAEKANAMDVALRVSLACVLFGDRLVFAGHHYPPRRGFATEVAAPLAGPDVERSRRKQPQSRPCDRFRVEP